MNIHKKKSLVSPFYLCLTLHTIAETIQPVSKAKYILNVRKDAYIIDIFHKLTVKNIIDISHFSININKCRRMAVVPERSLKPISDTLNDLEYSRPTDHKQK